ncbi:Tat pathway signal sequence domain protein [Streptomyces bambusae]|uniref:Tat pathway signal sequence domain protein n=1 Tax=Streptomyces bambusae TaxID=1550616 RepID=UPI001CFCD2C1|nr:Tat pathway signal sequence domain protein [Streptomyces bambusae]MCB5165595.1 Tat pathway signal sequence domain protein [Streptomyces bambusae]
MHITVRRHLGKLLAGAAIAVTGTAVAIGVTLPGSADAAGSGRDGKGGANGTGAVTEAAGGGAPQGLQNVHPGTVEAAPAEQAKGFGRDPLTDSELDRVKTLALGPAGMKAENARGGQGPQWLATDLAELRPEDVSRGRAPRRAQVTSYDYKTDSLKTSVVNLDTGKVESTDVQQGVQPPIAREEAVEAVKLIIASKQGEGLRKDYRDATGKKLTKPEQLSLKNALIYRVDGENPGPAAVTDCGRHRCARLFLKVKNGPWIDVRSLVVDLSARTVHRL